MPFVFAGMFGPKAIEFSDGTHATGTPVVVYEGMTGTTLAELYGDRDRIASVTNPIATDSMGNLRFFAEPGFYRIKYAFTESLVVVPIDPEELDFVEGGEGGGPVSWTAVTEKPSTFPPSSHTHVQSEITGLTASLSGKAATSHTHTIANVTGLQTELDDLEAAIASIEGGGGGPVSWAAVTDKPSTFPPTTPIAQADIDGLTASLAGKATPADITTAINNLVAAAPGALNTLDELAAALGDDANFASTMTTALGQKAPLASPAFTGNPTAPTPSPGDNDTTIATTAFVQSVVNPSAARSPLRTKMRPMAPRTLAPEAVALSWGASPGYSGQKTLSASTHTGKLDRGARLWFSGSFGYNVVSENTDNINMNNPFMVEFWVNGDSFAALCSGFNGVQNEYRVYVDGWDVTGWVTNTQSSGQYYLKFQYGAGTGTTTVRHVRIILAGGFAWGGVATPSTGYPWPAAQDRFRMAMIGNSYTSGSSATHVNSGRTACALSMGVANYTGWEIYSMGQGGTGYLSGDAVSTVYGSSARMAALAALPVLDAIYVAGCGNDIANGFSSSATVAAAVSLWDAIAAARPGVPIIVNGVETFGITYSALATWNPAMKAAAEAHPAVRGYIDWTAPEQWISGTGRVDAKNGSGNADIFMGTDGVHPTLAGFDYLSQRIANALASVKV